MKGGLSSQCKMEGHSHIQAFWDIGIITVVRYIAQEFF